MMLQCLNHARIREFVWLWTTWPVNLDFLSADVVLLEVSSGRNAPDSGGAVWQISSGFKA